jgi:hypothetical protein
MEVRERGGHDMGDIRRNRSRESRRSLRLYKNFLLFLYIQIVSLRRKKEKTKLFLFFWRELFGSCSCRLFSFFF